MRKYEPMLAKAASKPFTSGDWIFEIKWDGVRAISYVGETLSIRSRNNVELVDKFPELMELKDLASNTILDGEIVVIRDRKSDFQILIERTKARLPGDIEFMSRRYPATYIVFDVLEKDGKPLISLPLIERKRLLVSYVKESPKVILSVFVEENGEAYYTAALEKGVEGIMAKKIDSTYEPGQRSGNWLKIKRLRSCDCVIFGYTKGEGARSASFGALILGLYDRGDPAYIGKVGSGFSDHEIMELLVSFESLITAKETLKGLEIAEEITWLEPKVVCEVEYQSVTVDGKLRLARFKRIRLDKTPFECTIDQIRQDKLDEYAKKRDFNVTPEPSGAQIQDEKRPFVIQEHHARRLHYDLRLEKDGVLKSWAVPKGVPEEAGEKRLAVQVEDHPIEYSKFEGTIPAGEYGAGTVTVWDRGNYQSKSWETDKIEFILHGKKLQGRYVLARFKKAGKNNWILLKARD
jgi:DNA ligase D-like protein (predicted ligase)/DNA ligase D-like protein (predicted 3'-phosphoesterase)